MVIIKPETARFFLEQSDKVHNLTKRKSLDSLAINNLTKQLKTDSLIIQSYKQDSVTLNKDNATYSLELTLKNKTLDSLSTTLNSERIISSTLIGSTTGAIMGSVVPGVGTLTGGLIGGACGFLIRVIKHRKHDK